MKILVDKMPDTPEECRYSYKQYNRAEESICDICGFSGRNVECWCTDDCPLFMEVPTTDEEHRPEEKQETRVHDIKIQPPYFDDVCCGNKTFEVRKNDRDYRVGDILNLQEYDNNFLYGWHYTGREYKVRISYIMDNTDFCKDGYVIIGIKPMEQENNNE